MMDHIFVCEGAIVGTFLVVLLVVVGDGADVLALSEQLVLRLTHPPQFILYLTEIVLLLVVSRLADGLLL